MSGEIRGENKTAPEGAVGPDRSGGVQNNATPRESRPGTPARTRTAVLIDGFNLYHGMREKFGRRYLWLDLRRMAGLIRPRDEIVRVYYYTALVENDPDGRRRQETYLAALAAHNGPEMEVVLGRFQRKSQKCRTCGAAWASYEEKETDVNIAIGLVTAAASRAVDLTLLVTADSDLCPAIRAARSIAPAMGRIAAFPPKRSSFEIRSLVPGSLMIGPDKLRRSLLPEVVVDAGAGCEYRRPMKWQ